MSILEVLQQVTLPSFGMMCSSSQLTSAHLLVSLFIFFCHCHHILMYIYIYICMYVCMRFGTAKTQLRAAGGYFSLPPWLNNPFSKWWSGICAFRNAQNSDCYFSLLYSAWADHEMGLTTSSKAT